MANSAQAAKRARQAEKNRQHNTSMRSAMRTSVKKTIALIEAGEKEAATTAFRDAQSQLDGMARKGIISANRAARSKSRLNARIKAM